MVSIAAGWVPQPPYGFDPTAEEATMTNFEHDLPEADVAEQQMTVDSADEPVLDVDYLQDRSEAEADPADLAEQAVDVPMPDDAMLILPAFALA